MKTILKKIILISFLCVSGYAFTQVTIKKLNDPSIVAQHKRMVFESWGDWRPYPKYIFGIQTNFAYATVWGGLAPPINRDYKNGEDIRPLKPNGIEVQRLLELKKQEQEAIKINTQVDTLQKRSLQDFVHWTSVTVDADPLWLLYYKRMLSPLHYFPENPSGFTEWQMKPENFNQLNSIGTIARLQKELDLLKDKYKMSRTMDMPRGKRFIMYNETLIGWRKWIGEIRSYNDKTTLLLDFKKLLENKNFLPSPSTTSAEKATDKAIVQKTMNHFKHQF